VKRIQPAVFQAPDLAREVHTTLLWVFEGFTSYYDDLTLLRSGVIDLPAYLGVLAQTITRVMRGAGRIRQSIAESSFDAWTKFYKQDENAPNAVVSYYAKGALVAFGLDMTLRARTGGKASLDDLMRMLWVRHGRAGVGVADGDVERLAGELAGSDLSDFFARYVYGTAELPLVAWFDVIGVGCRLRGAAKPDDLGGFVESVEPSPSRKVLGARFQAAGDLVQLTHVFRGGAAHEAGLSAGDRLVAIDGLQTKPDRLAEQVAALPDDRPALVHALRRDELMTFSLVPLPAPNDACDLWLPGEDASTERKRQRRVQWLTPNGRRRGERG
jgi:predicted metalloprotease with PDZ domain